MSKTITALRDITPELRHAMLGAINAVHYVQEVTLTRDAAVAFIAAVNDPLRQLQNKFDMPSGKVIKVQRHPR